MSQTSRILCSSCGNPFHGLTSCLPGVIPESPDTPYTAVSVSLQVNQWTVVLKSMEIARAEYQKQNRALAERAITEAIEEIRLQLTRARNNTHYEAQEKP